MEDPAPKPPQEPAKTWRQSMFSGLDPEDVKELDLIRNFSRTQFEEWQIRAEDATFEPSAKLFANIISEFLLDERACFMPENEEMRAFVGAQYPTWREGGADMAGKEWLSSAELKKRWWADIERIHNLLLLQQDEQKTEMMTEMTQRTIFAPFSPFSLALVLNSSTISSNVSWSSSSCYVHRPPPPATDKWPSPLIPDGVLAFNLHKIANLPTTKLRYWPGGGGSKFFLPFYVEEMTGEDSHKDFCKLAYLSVVFLHHYHELCKHNGILLPLPVNEDHEAVRCGDVRPMQVDECSFYYKEDQQHSPSGSDPEDKKDLDYVPLDDENENDDDGEEDAVKATKGDAVGPTVLVQEEEEEDVSIDVINVSTDQRHMSRDGRGEEDASDNKTMECQRQTRSMTAAAKATKGHTVGPTVFVQEEEEEEEDVSIDVINVSTDQSHQSDARGKEKKDEEQEDVVVNQSPNKRHRPDDAGDEKTTGKKQRQGLHHGEEAFVEWNGPQDRFWFLSVQLHRGATVRYYLTWREPLINNKYVFIDLLPQALDLFAAADREVMMRIALNYVFKVGYRLHDEVLLKLLERLAKGEDIFPEAYYDPKQKSSIQTPAKAGEGDSDGDGKGDGEGDSEGDREGDGDGDGDGDGKGDGDGDEGSRQHEGSMAGKEKIYQHGARSCPSSQQVDAIECTISGVDGPVGSDVEKHASVRTRKLTAAEAQVSVELEVDLSRVLHRSNSSPTAGVPGTWVMMGTMNGQEVVVKAAGTRHHLSRTLFHNESRILSRIEGRHHTVKLLASCETTKFGFAWKPSVLVFENVQLAGRPHPENPQEVVTYCQHLFLALEYCHSLGIVHSDVKRANMLWHAERKCGTLIDFGFAKDQHTPPELRKFNGTPGYWPPEFKNSPAGDMWSAGVLLHKLIHLPDECPTEDDIKYIPKRSTLSTICSRLGRQGQGDCQRVRAWKRLRRHQHKCQQRFTNDMWAQFNLAGDDLLNALLQREPQARPTASQVLAHPFFTSVAL